MERNDFFLAGAVLIAVAVSEGVGLAIAGAASQTAAAWAQAFGGIAAVGVAFAAPFIAQQQLRKDRDKDRRQRSVNVVKGLWMPVMALGESLINVAIRLDEQKGIAPGDAVWDDWFERTKLVVPPQCLRFKEIDHELDLTVVGSYRDLIDHALAYNSSVETWKALGPVAGAPAWEQARSGLEGYLYFLAGIMSAVACAEGREDWGRHLRSRLPPDED